MSHLERFDRLSDNLKGAVILMAAALGFTIMVALIKLAGQRLPVSQILFVRQLGMVLMLGPVFLRSLPDAFNSANLPLQFARITLALIAMSCGFTAVINMPLAEATAIAFAKSFFVTIFAVLILKEVVGPYRWAAVVVGFVGVMVMLRPGAEGFSVYGLLALVGAASAGMVMVIIRLLSRTDAPTTILAFQAVGVGIVMSVPAFIQWVPPTPGEWLLLAAIGVVSFFSQRANIQAFSYGEASLLASLDYVRLLYATLFGWWLFQELPSTSTWVGAGIIVAASIYTVHREARRRQSLSSSPGGRNYSSH